MREVSIARGMIRMEEMWTQGKVTSLRLSLNYFVDDMPISVTEVWQIPEDEQLWAEDWYSAKQENAGPILMRAAAETNLEYLMFCSITDYINSLPTE
jgi:hypothetical protein